MHRIVLTGLDVAIEAGLSRVLDEEGHKVTVRDCSDLEDADLVFCNGDAPDYEHLIRSLSQLKPALPVVVVTRLPEADRWISALEAGAADYCAAPFERIQVRWILESVLKQRPLAAVA